MVFTHIQYLCLLGERKGVGGDGAVRGHPLGQGHQRADHPPQEDPAGGGPDGDPQVRRPLLLSLLHRRHVQRAHPRHHRLCAHLHPPQTLPQQSGRTGFF